MASAGAVAGVAGQAAAVIPGLVGKGKSEHHSEAFYGNPDAGYDPNAVEYGGAPGGLQQRREQLGYLGGKMNDAANTYNQQQQQMYGRGNQSLDQANQARGNQVDAMGMARARATGAVPSTASMQAAQDMNRAVAEQTSAAASARGPAALALAQQNAAANAAGAQTNISNAAQVNAANERERAEQSYAAQAAGLRGGDVNQAGQAFGAAAQSGQTALGYSNAAQGYDKLQNDAIAQAGQMKVQGQQVYAQAQQAANAQNAQTAAQNAESKGTLETIGDFFSDERAKQGVTSLEDAMATQVAKDREESASARIDARVRDMIASDNKSEAAKIQASFTKDAADAKAASAEQEKRDAEPPAWASIGKSFADAWEADRRGRRSYGWHSDVGSKMNIGSLANIGGASAIGEMSGVGAGSSSVEAPTFDKLTAGGGGMDVAGSLEAHAAAGTRNLEDPTGGMMSDVTAKNVGPMLSDMTSKTPGYLSDERAKGGVLPLYEPEGKQLYWDNERGAGLADAAPAADRLKARITSDGGGSGGETAKPKAKPGSQAGKRAERKMSADEMARWADAETAKLRSATDAAERHGPYGIRPRGDDPMADANRALAPSVYEYKPEFRPSDQAPGEKNVGPMAQNMAADPVASTAVKRDPETGLLAIDRDKATKLTMGGLASLQQQVDELRARQRMEAR